VALDTLNSNIAVNIELEDWELDQLEGLKYAADTLLKAASTSRR
jgi:hypothetical protein